MEPKKIKNKPKLTGKEIKLEVTGGREWGQGNWRKVIKRHRLPVADTMNNVMTIASTSV